MRDDNSRLVYSTDHRFTKKGNQCPGCGKKLIKCRCKESNPAPAKADGIIRVEKSTKGRKGKGVSLIRGLDLDLQELRTLSKKLKQKCGTGGTIKNGVIEIQGDHRDTLVKELSSLGFKVKKAGG